VNRRALGLLILFVCACDKKDGPKTDPGATGPSVGVSVSPSVGAGPSVGVGASPSAGVGVSPGASVGAGPSASVGTTTGVSVGPRANVGVGSGSAANAPTATPTAELPGAEGMTASADHWAITVPAPKTCATGSPCPLVVKLEAKDGFHVNEEYPTKLELEASKTFEGLGTTASKPNVFTKAAGNFAIDGAHGTMTATIKPLEGGLAKLSGTFKFSVCSAANCQMGTAQVKATLPVR
jgi:hypothetical protein